MPTGWHSIHEIWGDLDVEGLARPELEQSICRMLHAVFDIFHDGAIGVTHEHILTGRDVLRCTEHFCSDGWEMPRIRVKIFNLLTSELRRLTLGTTRGDARSKHRAATTRRRDRNTRAGLRRARV
jgi:hypothetical protein